jgi:hypothetical protein
MADWHVVLSVALTIIVKLTLRIRDQHCGSACYAIDRSDSLAAFVLKTHSRAHTDIELPRCAFLLGDQIVLVLRMAEQATSDRLETRCGATTVFPDQHLNEMNQLML